MDENTSLILGTAWTVLSLVGYWLLFRKAGKPGWHCLIPILNAYDEFDICWKGGKVFLAALLAAIAGGCTAAGQDDPVVIGVAAVAGLWLLIIHWKQSMKLAASFGKGAGTGFLLFLFDRVARVILGLSGAKYVGKK
ncbi:MAG: hypothetical protein IJI45_14535 [Anaerolineaceae bacterium]|nr:hypothetical protein [Anaerolineaceae bacterium]